MNRIFPGRFFYWADWLRLFTKQVETNSYVYIKTHGTFVYMLHKDANSVDREIEYKTGAQVTRL